MKNKCIYFEYTQGGIHLKIAMLGWGTVARSLMEQIEKRHDPELQVAAILIRKPHPRCPLYRTGLLSVLHPHYSNCPLCCPGLLPQQHYLYRHSAYHLC